MSPNNTVQLPITGGIRVTVPDDSGLMTNYVLREQQDWFEDEIKFVREYIKPGMNAIDIGANYGLYTLTIASKIGETGKLWSFEPTERTAACLRASIEDNHFKNIRLIQAGLSNKTGKAKFFTSPNSEMNSLSAVHDGGSTETITLLTLDSCLQQYKIHDVDFMKIDAEGEEANILKKAKNTLSQNSPLIMFELMHGSSINTALLNRLVQTGHRFYRLVPGTNTLVAFDPDKQETSFVLNLFACRPDKAGQLAAEGIIVDLAGETPAVDGDAARHQVAQLASHEAMAALFDSPDTLAATDYLAVLNACAAALSPELPANVRTRHLVAAVPLIEAVTGNPAARVEQLATCARIAFDAGQRRLGVNILARMIKMLDEDGDREILMPCFPPTAAFDSIRPKEGLSKWLHAATLDAYVHRSTHSGYFSQGRQIPIFQELAQLGYLTPDSQRRMEVAQQHF